MGFNINVGNRDSNLSRNQSLLFFSIFMVIGLLLAGYGYTQYQGQTQSIDNAVRINVTITETNVRTDSSRRGGVDYHAEADFDYTYEGESYSSSFIYPLDDDKEFNTESKAQEYINNYPQGENVEAFINPNEPGKAFFNAKRSDQPLLLMVIGGLMIVLGGFKTTTSLI